MATTTEQLEALRRIEKEALIASYAASRDQAQAEYAVVTTELALGLRTDNDDSARLLAHLVETTQFYASAYDRVAL